VKPVAEVFRFANGPEVGPGWLLWNADATAGFEGLLPRGSSGGDIGSRALAGGVEVAEGGLFASESSPSSLGLVALAAV
jgi:hypothetical protein